MLLPWIALLAGFIILVIMVGMICDQHDQNTLAEIVAKSTKKNLKRS